jgi:hypothetical protein
MRSARLQGLPLRAPYLYTYILRRSALRLRSKLRHIKGTGPTADYRQLVVDHIECLIHYGLVIGQFFWPYTGNVGRVEAFWPCGSKNTLRLYVRRIGLGNLSVAKPYTAIETNAGVKPWFAVKIALGGFVTLPYVMLVGIVAGLGGKTTAVIKGFIFAYRHALVGVEKSRLADIGTAQFDG